MIKDKLILQFRTEVEPQKCDFSLDYSSKTLFMGSCFSDVVGAKMRELLFDAVVNPFGVLFNPSSISMLLWRSLKSDLFCENDFCKSPQGFFSFFLHSDFTEPVLERSVEKANSALALVKNFILNGSVLVLTLGSANVFELQDSGKVVANCHRENADLFNERMLSIDEIVGEYKTLLNEIHHLNSNLKVVFTVSPIRHLKFGAHKNNMSKSILLLAVERLCKETDFVHYFESFEIMMDELRDYRFYDEDMVHPSEMAKEYIFEKFSHTFFSQQTLSLLPLAKKISQRKRHRLKNPESPESLSFLEETENMELHFRSALRNLFTF